jgi:hypothetical protein
MIFIVFANITQKERILYGLDGRGDCLSLNLARIKTLIIIIT